MADQSFIFAFSEKLRYCFFDFRIRQTGGDIFRNNPVKGQEMIKLPHGQTRDLVTWIEGAL